MAMVIVIYAEGGNQIGNHGETLNFRRDHQARAELGVFLDAGDYHAVPRRVQAVDKVTCLRRLAAARGRFDGGGLGTHAFLLVLIYL